MAVITDGCRHTLTSINLSHCPSISHDALLVSASRVRACMAEWHLTRHDCDHGMHTVAEWPGWPPAKALRSAQIAQRSRVRQHQRRRPDWAGEGVSSARVRQLLQVHTGEARSSLRCAAFAEAVLNACALVARDQITNKGLMALTKGCPRLRVMNLERNKLITDAALCMLGTRCRMLRSLNLAGYARLTGLWHLIACSPHASVAVGVPDCTMSRTALSRQSRKDRPRCSS